MIAAFITEHAGGRIAGAQIEPLAEALTNGLAGLALWWIDNPDVSKDVPVDVGTRLVTAPL